MAERKGTPDVLSQVLGPLDESAPAAVAEALERATSPAQTRAPVYRRAASAPAAPRWEYLLVSFQEHGGWRPRFANGVELANWTGNPLIHDYAGQLGEEGWELAAASGGQPLYGAADLHQMYFKRPIR